MKTNTRKIESDTHNRREACCFEGLEILILDIEKTRGSLNSELWDILKFYIHFKVSMNDSQPEYDRTVDSPQHTEDDKYPGYVMWLPAYMIFFVSNSSI